MASLILKMSVSLDGYVAPPDGSSDWVTAGRSEDGAPWTLETVSNASCSRPHSCPRTGPRRQLPPGTWRPRDQKHQAHPHGRENCHHAMR
jgi:hypothetical protein